MGRLELALRLMGMGWYVGFCIVAGVGGGLWLDRKLHTTPLLIMVGLLLGIIVAVYGVYKMILPNIIKQKRNGEKS